MTIPNDVETSIHQSVWNALIEATPQWWRAAMLEVTWTQDTPEVEGFDHLIISPEGYRDIVGATDGMTAATMQLADLYRKYGKKWRKVVYEVEQTAGGSWSCRVQFQYY